MILLLVLLFVVSRLPLGIVFSFEEAIIVGKLRFGLLSFALFPRTKDKKKKASKAKQEGEKGKTKKASRFSRFTYQEVKELFSLFLSFFPRFLRHINIHPTSLQIEFGGSSPANAAEYYAIACVLLSWAKPYLSHKHKKQNVHLSLTFGEKTILYRGRLEISLSLGYACFAFFSLLCSVGKWYVRNRRGSTEKDNPTKEYQSACQVVG